MGTASAAISLRLERGGSVIDVGTSAETSTAFLITKAFELAGEGFVTFIERILYNVRDRTGNSTARLEIYGSDEEESGFELLDTIYFSDSDVFYTDPPGRRWFKFKFVDDSISQRWALHGLTIFGEQGGEEF
jgi:hypothetical protein